MAEWSKEVVQAIESNDAAFVEEFINNSQESDINIQNEEGDTYLHISLRVLGDKVLHSELDWVIASLLGKHVDKKLENKARELAAHILFPLVFEKPQLMPLLEEILTEEGIDDECFVGGKHMLNLALERNAFDLVRLLVRKKIYVATVDKSGIAAFNVFLDYCSKRGYRDYPEDILSALITPDTINQFGRSGFTPLMYVAHLSGCLPDWGK